MGASPLAGVLDGCGQLVEPHTPPEEGHRDPLALGALDANTQSVLVGHHRPDLTPGDPLGLAALREHQLPLAQLEVVPIALGDPAARAAGGHHPPERGKPPGHDQEPADGTGTAGDERSPGQSDDRRRQEAEPGDAPLGADVQLEAPRQRSTTLA